MFCYNIYFNIVIHFIIKGNGSVVERVCNHSIWDATTAQDQPVLLSDARSACATMIARETPFYLGTYLGTTAFCLWLQYWEDKLPVTMTQWPLTQKCDNIPCCYMNSCLFGFCKLLIQIPKECFEHLNHLNLAGKTIFACWGRYWRASC